MNRKQLKQIENFARPFYGKTGRYHTWKHILRVREHIRYLSKGFKSIDLKVLEAACYLHDIGRSVKNDESHSLISIKLSTPFLKRTGLNAKEINLINDAIRSHEISKILFTKKVESRILFDADKMEIASVAGFIRMLFFLTEEMGMKDVDAINLLWRKIKLGRRKFLYSNRAKRIIDKELPVIQKMVHKLLNWEKRFVINKFQMPVL